MDSPASVAGNLVRDPALRYTQANVPVVNITVALNRINTKTGQSVTSFFDVTVWGDLAVNIAESLRKGDRVLVTGRWETQTWEDLSGQYRSKNIIVADDVGPSLRKLAITYTDEPEDSEVPA